MSRQLIVDFSHKIRNWDGFGFNYVQAAQTRDILNHPQEYGGFSLLSETDRETILDMVFGDDGLKPGVIKMFLDSFHQDELGEGYNFDPNHLDMAAYDHMCTTVWMTYCIKEGVKRTRQRGVDPEIVVTLYGPPGWATKQKMTRGRDLDPEMKYEVGKYIISWAKFLREEHNLNVRYLSLHNEGADYKRWPADGSDHPGMYNHDYNWFSPPDQIVDFIKFMTGQLKALGLDKELSITPGETTFWRRFYEAGYASAITEDPEAMEALGLITSHGFGGLGQCCSAGIDLLRERRPGLHAWVTSTSWAKMDVDFVSRMREHVYLDKVNAVIPWAGIQRAGKWIGGDPNPGTAFRVYDDGTWDVQPGYYFYKGICRAGQPGMSVAKVISNDGDLNLMGFGSNGTENPNAFSIMNVAQGIQEVTIDIKGNDLGKFAAFSTSPIENYVDRGIQTLKDGKLNINLSSRSVTTFFELSN